MKNVSLKFRNHEITIHCNDEVRVLELSNKLNIRAEELYKSQYISDTKRIYLTALAILDELEAAKQELSDLKHAILNKSEKHDRVLCDTLNEATDYIQSLTKTLEN